MGHHPIEHLLDGALSIRFAGGYTASASPDGTWRVDIIPADDALVQVITGIPREDAIGHAQRLAACSELSAPDLSGVASARAS